jgi:predicted kinase
VSQSTLYLVCGLPGAGKTTRSQQILEKVKAVYVGADDWVVALGMSLVDFDFRVKLQHCLLAHAGSILRTGVSVVLEFGSWHRQERDAIRQVAQRAGAATELHFVNAPLDELVRRVRARGGRDAEILATQVLIQDSSRFEHPSPEEARLFDRYFGPSDAWMP